MITINFQDQGAPLLYGSDDRTNSFLFRGLIPNKLEGYPQLIRFTLPVTTVPDGTGHMTTGLGDLNVFDLFPLRAGKMEIAAVHISYRHRNSNRYQQMVGGSGEHTNRAAKVGHYRNVADLAALLRR